MTSSSKKLTVSVGISAYNEQDVVQRLLRQVINQETNGFVLKEVVVSSDGSSDKTVAQAKRVKSRKIRVWDNKDRKGKSARMNEFFQKLKTDIVIILDADIVLTHSRILQELVTTFIQNPSVSLVSGVVTPTPTSGFEQIITVGHELMREAIQMAPRPEVYTCTGAIRGFKKKLYSHMRFPQVYAEDIYPYLYCKTHGFGYAVAGKAVVTYSVPKSYRSFTRQMVRYLSSTTDHSGLFGRSIVQHEFSITSWIKAKALIKVFVRKPVQTITYLVLLIQPKLIHLTQSTPTNGYWQITR